MPKARSTSVTPKSDKKGDAGQSWDIISRKMRPSSLFAHWSGRYQVTLEGIGAQDPVSATASGWLVFELISNQQPEDVVVDPFQFWVPQVWRERFQGQPPYLYLVNQLQPAQGGPSVTAEQYRQVAETVGPLFTALPVHQYGSVPFREPLARWWEARQKLRDILELQARFQNRDLQLRRARGGAYLKDERDLQDEQHGTADLISQEIAALYLPGRYAAPYGQELPLPANDVLTHKGFPPVLPRPQFDGQTSQFVMNLPYGIQVFSVMVLFNQQAEMGNVLRTCRRRRCGQLFFGRPNRQYCCISCRVADKSRRHRAKKRVQSQSDTAEAASS